MAWRRLTIAVLVIVECALLAAIVPLPKSLKLKKARQLADLPADEARAKLLQLDHLPVEFLPTIVGFLGHEDDQLVHLARRKLINAMQLRRITAPEKSREFVAVLARSLVEQVDDFRLAGKRQAVRLAEAILNWPLPPAPETVEILNDVRTVLSRTQHLWTVKTTPAPATLLSGPSYGPLITPNASVASFPGGGVPLQPSELPQEARELPPDPPSARVDSREPQLLKPPPDAKPEPPKSLPAGPARRILPFQPRADNEPDSRQPLLLPEATDPIGLSPNSSTIRLVQALRARRPDRQRQAVQLLTQRGFGDEQFDLAARLNSSDPEVRLALVLDLPGARGINPVPWLLLMAEDDDRRVRAAAIATVATSKRRSVLEQLIRLEKTERDAQVLTQLREAIQIRRQ